VTFTYAEVEQSLRATHRGEFSTSPTIGKPVITIVDGEQIEITYQSQQRPMDGQ
jgi:hypothetical protein